MNEIDHLFKTAMQNGPSHLDHEDWNGANWAWKEAKSRYQLAWQVIDLLRSHSGETGKDEGALEILQQILRERDELRQKNEVLVKANELWPDDALLSLDQKNREIANLERERDEAWKGHNFEETEKAVQYLWTAIQGLHSDVLRADGDLSQLRKRMQSPWFELSQERKRLLCMYETLLNKIDHVGDLERSVCRLSAEDEVKWRELRKQVRETEWFMEVTE